MKIPGPALAGRLFRTVFPAPHRPLTTRRALPLVVFLVVFGAACVGVELFGMIVFTNPRAFLLAVVIPWVWWMHTAGWSGLRGSRSVAALLVRLSIVGVFIALMAEPRAVRESNVLSVVYALDVSDSIGEAATDASLAFITRTVSEKPEKDEAGLVAFAREAAVELAPRVSFPLDTLNSRMTKDGTNIQRGLSLAGALLPAENRGRVVLISDGTQTEGNVSEVVEELRSRRIPVDVLPVQYVYEHEVWLEKLELPRFVRAGETYEAAVVLSSLTAGTGKLTLRENGREVYEGDVEFKAGKNRYVLPLYMREPGYYEYLATITVPAGLDGWAENNMAAGYVFLRGRGKTLVVTDPGGDPRDSQSLVAALKQGDFDVEEHGAYEFPWDALSLMPYDCVIFVNVPADALDVVQMEALHDAVYSQGVGFLMVGGQNSFGPGGWRRTAVEKALPVTMDDPQRKRQPAGAIVFVLDRSGSMSLNVRGTEYRQQQLANRATLLAAQTLLPGDMAGVIAFDVQSRWVVPLGPVQDPEDFSSKVWSIGPGGGTDIYPALVEALAALQNVSPSQAAVRHILLLSDGQTLEGDHEGIARKIAENGMSLSTVAIGDNPNLTLMGNLAELGGGTAHRVDDPYMLPKIFIKEALTLRRTMIQNKTFTPQVEVHSPVLKGIDAFPELGGFVLTMPRKGRAITILRAPKDKDGGDEEIDPVLATWRYGLAKTAAFTSDLSPNWGAAWVQWDRYVPFVKQLVTDISRTEREGYLQMQAFASGETGVVLVEDTHPPFDGGGNLADPQGVPSQDSFLDVEVTVTGPQRRSQTVRLRQIGPRTYEGQFPLWGKGRYQVVGAGVGDGRTERMIGGLVVPYSQEYLRFRSNPIVLSEIARKTGGRMLTGDESGGDVFLKEGGSKSTSRPVADLFLVVLACLIPFDVGVRRIQLDWGLILGWLRIGRKIGSSGETLEALLRRKKTLAGHLADPQGVPRERRLRPPRVGVPGRDRKEGPPVLQTKQEADQERLSTTERLLARKKKRWSREQ